MSKLFFLCALMYASHAHAYLFLPVSEIDNIKTRHHDKLQAQDVRILGANYVVGIRYNNKGMRDEGFPYFYFCKGFLEYTQSTGSPFYSLSLGRLADYYYKINDLETAKSYLLLWAAHPYKLETQQYSIYNTLGLIHVRLKEFDAAAHYYQLALNFAHFRKHELWQSIIYGNLGELYLEKKDFATAKTYLNQEIAITENRKFPTKSSGGSWCHSLDQLASIALQEDSLELALYYLERANQTYKILGSEQMPSFHDVKATYFMRKNMLDSAMYYFDMRDKKIAAANQKRVSQMHHANSSVEAIASVQLEKSIATFEKKVFIKFLSNATILVLTCGAMVFLLVRLQRYYKRNKSVRTRSRIIKGDLEEHHGAIRILFEEIKSLNEERSALEFFELKLKTTGFVAVEVHADLLKNEISRVKLVTEKAWIDFKNQFTTAYPNFLENLIISQPNISTGEQRLACMIRLNLTTNQMAEMTGVSHDSVKKSMLRFKKKLEFDNLEDLIDFIFSLPV